MAITIKQANTAKCPAVEVQQPVLSPHDIDHECRIMGNIFPVGQRPCNGDYAGCRVWIQARKQEMEATAKQRAMLRQQRAEHTLSGKQTRTVQKG